MFRRCVYPLRQITADYILSCVATCGLMYFNQFHQPYSLRLCTLQLRDHANPLMEGRLLITKRRALLVGEIDLQEFLTLFSILYSAHHYFPGFCTVILNKWLRWKVFSHYWWSCLLRIYVLLSWRRPAKQRQPLSVSAHFIRSMAM